MHIAIGRSRVLRPAVLQFPAAPPPSIARGTIGSQPMCEITKASRGLGLLKMFGAAHCIDVPAIFTILRVLARSGTGSATRAGRASRDVSRRGRGTPWQRLRARKTETRKANYPIPPRTSLMPYAGGRRRGPPRTGSLFRRLMSLECLLPARGYCAPLTGLAPHGRKAAAQLVVRGPDLWSLCPAGEHTSFQPLSVQMEKTRRWTD